MKFFESRQGSLLGGSGVVISRVISPLIWVISIVTLLRTLLITSYRSRVISPFIWVRSIVTLLRTLLITTPEPPSNLKTLNPTPYWP